MNPGRVLGGRHLTGEVVGRGGTVEVRVGHGIRTGRSVAIEALRTTSAEDPLPRSHLRCEAQLLTGRPPSTGDDPIFVAHQHVHEPAPQADTGVPAVDAVIATVLAEDRAERFRSARAFRHRASAAPH